MRPEYYSCARYSCIQWCFFGTALLGCVCVCSTVCMHTCVPAGEVCVMHLVLPATCYRQQAPRLHMTCMHSHGASALRIPASMHDRFMGNQWLLTQTGHQPEPTLFGGMPLPEAGGGKPCAHNLPCRSWAACTCLLQLLAILPATSHHHIHTLGQRAATSSPPRVHSISVEAHIRRQLMTTMAPAAIDIDRCSTCCSWRVFRCQWQPMYWVVCCKVFKLQGWCSAAGHTAYSRGSCGPCKVVVGTGACLGR